MSIARDIQYEVLDLAGRPALARGGRRVAALPQRLSAPHAPSVQFAGPLLVAVVGPPGAGKSTVVAELVSEHDVSVFRLREMIRAHPELLADLGPSTDPLGWVSLEAVRRILHATFVTDGFGQGCSVVLLDNFPGTADQLDLLAETATTTAARVALLELHADADTVVTRVAQRRVCLTCGSDSHAPVVPAAEDPQRCGSCRTVLARRDTDVPRLHGLRLARYVTNLPEIAERTAELSLSHMSVNANATTSEVRRAANHALYRLTALAAHSGSRP